MPLRVGARLGHYKVTAKLGEGGMGDRAGACARGFRARFGHYQIEAPLGAGGLLTLVAVAPIIGAILVDDHLSNWCHCHASQFQMLPGEGYGDDRKRKQSGKEEMPECQPPASDDEPDNVAEQAQATRPEVFTAGRNLAVDDFSAKGP